MTHDHESDVCDCEQCVVAASVAAWREAEARGSVARTLTPNVQLHEDVKALLAELSRQYLSPEMVKVLKRLRVVVGE